jgi:hypothetical protein
MRILAILFLIIWSVSLKGMGISAFKHDSLRTSALKKSPELFYDSLQTRASRHKFTRWLYHRLICQARDTVNTREVLSYEYYKSFGNRTIGTIRIKSLDVFGPDFDDTTRVAKVGIERLANKLHSKSNVNVIRKNLWIKEGQQLDPDLLMDNERLLRSLPYLKDVRFVLTPRPDNGNVVDVLILTKDVFSFGLTGSIGNINKGDFGVYDKNILGVGHDVGIRMVAHTNKTPHIGFETYYAINNVMGNFIDASAGYANTWQKQEVSLSLQRDFLRPQSVYAGGITLLRTFRSNQLNSSDVVVNDSNLNFIYLDGWYGRSLRLGLHPNDSRFQMTLAGRVRYTSFFARPAPDSLNNQYFANSTFYLAGLSFSQRSYIRDHLVYSYGITEDIPKGYLHELVFGYDHNEFGDRWYSHLFLSSGNIFRKQPFYFYASLGIGSFWRKTGLEQGIIDFKTNFISPLFHIRSIQSRQFVTMNYTFGINRFNDEFLLLSNPDGIRGFGSHVGKGQQRLTLKIENVFFQNTAFYNFKSAFFTFFDLGVIGSPDKVIFADDYYAGIGVGLRIRNENLIFKTIQLRLAFYPYHPSDVSAVGFILDEVSKSSFYSFQPRGPEPLKFR